MKTKSKFLRILSLVSALAVLVACNTLFSSVSAEETSNVWDGTAATEPSGSGEADNPYLIANGENLRWLLNQITSKSHTTVGAFDSAPTTFGKFYKLTNDIYLNDVSSEKWYEGDSLHSWDYGNNSSVLGNPANFPFLGTLDGDGHTINGLYCNSDAQYVSLFPSIGTNAVVKNLKIANSYIKTTYETKDTGAAAALFATTGAHWDTSANDGNGAHTLFAETPVITKCAVEESVIVNAPYRAAAFIGKVGRNLEISDCLTAADVSVQNVTTNGNKGKLAAGFAAVVMPDVTGATQFFDLKNSLVVNKSGLVPCNASKHNYLKTVAELNNKANQLNCVYMLKNDSDYTSGYGKTIYEKTQTIDSIALIQGDAAKSTLKGFDFDNTWQSVQGGTPVLMFTKSEITKHAKAYVYKGSETATAYANGTVAFGANFEAIKAYLAEKNITEVTEVGFVYSTGYQLEKSKSELDFDAVDNKNAAKAFKADVSTENLTDNLYCILKSPFVENGSVSGAYLTTELCARAYVKYNFDGTEYIVYADRASAIAQDLLNNLNK